MSRKRRYGSQLERLKIVEEREELVLPPIVESDSESEEGEGAGGESDEEQAERFIDIDVHNYRDQNDLLFKLIRLHGKTWNHMLTADPHNAGRLNFFYADIIQMRDFLRCQICTKIVSDQPRLPLSKYSTHGPVCKECLTKYNGCHCSDKNCTLKVPNFKEVDAFTSLVKSYKGFCFMFLTSTGCQTLMEAKFHEEPTFDFIGLIQILNEGARKGVESFKNSILYDGLTDELGGPVATAPYVPGFYKETMTDDPEPPAAEINPVIVEPPPPIVENKKKSPFKTPAVPQGKKWSNGNKTYSYPVPSPPAPPPPYVATQHLEGNLYLADSKYFLGGLSSNAVTTTTDSTHTPLVVASSSTSTPFGITIKTEKPDTSAPVKKTTKGKNDSVKAFKGCRCGNAAANPGKLTCCGQRCPCYVDGKECTDCKCKGCRNPHLPDGKKILQGINAVLDTRTNETIPLQFPYITTQFFSNTNGQMMQPIFPLTASVASFNPFGMPVLSVQQQYHLSQQQQQPQP